MALINCPECNKEISDTSKRCPQCGYKIKKSNKKKIKPIKFAICIMAVIAIIVSIIALKISMPHNVGIDDFPFKQDIFSLGIAKEDSNSIKEYDNVKFEGYDAKILFYKDKTVRIELPYEEYNTIVKILNNKISLDRVEYGLFAYGNIDEKYEISIIPAGAYNITEITIYKR